MRNEIAKIEKNYQTTRNQLEKWCDLIFLIHPSEGIKYEEDGISIIDEFKTVEQFLIKTKEAKAEETKKSETEATKETKPKRGRKKKEEK